MVKKKTSRLSGARNSASHARVWDEVWNAKGLISTLVNSGRTFYNTFFYRLFLPFIKKRSVRFSMLEIGCGTAVFGLYLCKKFPKMKYTGVDISESALELSRKNAKSMGVKNCVFSYGDCFRLPQKENSFDIVWSQGLLEHFDNPEKIASEHYRVAKKGGRVFISVPAKFSYHYLWWKLTRPKLLNHFWPWTEQIFYTKKMFKELVKGTGWKCRMYMLPPFVSGLMILEIIK